MRGLDSDEAQFLTEVDLIRVKREREMRLEERREIDEIKISFFFVIKIKPSI